jgi:hypothetical protein
MHNFHYNIIIAALLAAFKWFDGSIDASIPTRSLITPGG